MGVRDAGVESTSFRHETSSLMLQAWKSAHGPTAMLVNLAPSTFRAWFAKGLEATGLSRAKYKPYSLRRGGATQVCLESQSYSAVCQRGRWASEKTTRIYIQDSVALLTELSSSLSPIQKQCQNVWVRLLSRLEQSKGNLGSKGDVERTADIYGRMAKNLQGRRASEWIFRMIITKRVHGIKMMV